jgi:hypothetical protein
MKKCSILGLLQEKGAQEEEDELRRRQAQDSEQQGGAAGMLQQVLSNVEPRHVVGACVFFVSMQ